MGWAAGGKRPGLSCPFLSGRSSAGWPGLRQASGRGSGCPSGPAGGWRSVPEGPWAAQTGGVSSTVSARPCPRGYHQREWSPSAVPTGPHPGLACGPFCWNPQALVPLSVRRGDHPARTQTRAAREAGAGPTRADAPGRCGQHLDPARSHPETRASAVPRQRARCTCPEWALGADAGPRGHPLAHRDADHGLGGPARPGLSAEGWGGGPGALGEAMRTLPADTLPCAGRTLGDCSWALTGPGLRPSGRPAPEGLRVG